MDPNPIRRVLQESMRPWFFLYTDKHGREIFDRGVSPNQARELQAHFNLPAVPDIEGDVYQ